MWVKWYHPRRRDDIDRTNSKSRRYSDRFKEIIDDDDGRSDPSVNDSTTERQLLAVRRRAS